MPNTVFMNIENIFQWNRNQSKINLITYRTLLFPMLLRPLMGVGINVL